MTTTRSLTRSPYEYSSYRDGREEASSTRLTPASNRYTAEPPSGRLSADPSWRRKLLQSLSEMEQMLEGFAKHLQAGHVAPAPSGRNDFSLRAGVKPTDIWGGFYQTVNGNCVTVSAIKASMMKFGSSPLGIYKSIARTADGYTVTMRDSYVAKITDAELASAARNSHFAGKNDEMLKDANFLYAVSAKRAQEENNEGRARESFEVAMATLNNGEYPGDAFRRLGLIAYVRHATMQELADGALGTLAYDRHSVAVIDGHEERFGVKGDPPPLERRLVAEYQAIKLV